MSDDLEQAILNGAARALRKRAVIQATKAKDGTGSAEGHPDVLIQTGQAVIAARMARDFNAIADELDG